MHTDFDSLQTHNWNNFLYFNETQYLGIGTMTVPCHDYASEYKENNWQ